MQPELLLSFLAASFLLALMPGPDNIFVITESLSKGQKNGIVLSFGLVSGVIIHTSLAASGMALLLKQSPAFYDLVKYLGAAYLGFLAWQAFREKPENVDFEKGKNTHFNFGKIFRTGFLMNVLNPKVTLFFLAFLPQFISEDGYPAFLQMFILGGIFMLQAFLLFSSFAILAGKLHKILNKPRFWTITKWLKISVLILLILFLIFS